MSLATSQEVSTSRSNCTTTDNSINLYPTNVSSHIDDKQQPQRPSRLSSDRRYDSYGGEVSRRYELFKANKRLENQGNEEDRRDENIDENFKRDRDKDAQGHASSHHLNNDRRFLSGASGDYFSRERDKNMQRHTTDRYLEDDHSLNLDFRRDYVNGNDMFETIPRHYSDEEKKYRNNAGSDEDKQQKGDRKSNWDRPIDRFDVDHEYDRTKINQEDREENHPVNRDNDKRVLKVNHDEKNERDRISVDRHLNLDDRNKDENAQTLSTSRYSDDESSRNYHDTFENKDTDKNLNVYPLNTNLNRNSKDEISEVIDKSLEVQPLGHDNSEEHTIDPNKDRKTINVEHVKFIERDDKHVDDSYPSKSLMDHKITDPVDYHHLHEIQVGQNSDDQNSKRHYKDPYDDRQPDRDSYHPSSDRDQHYERRNEKFQSSDYHETILPDKHKGERPSKDYSDNLHLERHTSDASVKKLTSKDHHNDFDSQASNQDFSIHKDPVTERRFGTNLYSNERFGDENYDRKIMSQIPNRYNDDDDMDSVPKVKDLNYDKYPDDKVSELDNRLILNDHLGDFFF